MENFTKRQMEIISASIKIIAAEGVQNLTIKNIALYIDLSEAAIYRHFASKMEILLAILAIFKTESQASITKALDSGARPLEILGMIILSHLDNFSITPSLASVIFSEEIFQNEKKLSAEVYALMRTNLTAVVDIIEKGQHSGGIRTDIPADHIATIVMGALRLQVNTWKLSQFSFDLKEEGVKLWATIKTLIKPKNE